MNNKIVSATELKTKLIFIIHALFFVKHYYYMINSAQYRLFQYI